MRSPIVKKQKPGPEKGCKKRKITNSNKEEFKRRFLEEYGKEDGTQQKAADLIGFRRQHVYKWAESDPEFARKFEEIKFNKANKLQAEFDEAHKYDEEAKKMFLELYADESNSVASSMEKVIKKFPDIKQSYLEYWIKTDFEFKKEYKRLQVLLRPGIAKALEIKKAQKQTELDIKKQQFLELFSKNYFNITNTANAMGIKRAVVDDWGKKDPDFASQIDALQYEKEDFAEDALFKLVEEGNTAAVIYLTKILLQRTNWARRHAYIEQPQKIEGYVQHDHKHSFDQDQLDALVRGRLDDRQQYENLLKLDDPNTIDCEYDEEEILND